MTLRLERGESERQSEFIRKTNPLHTLKPTPLTCLTQGVFISIPTSFLLSCCQRTPSSRRRRDPATLTQPPPVRRSGRCRFHATLTSTIPPQTLATPTYPPHNHHPTSRRETIITVALLNTNKSATHRATTTRPSVISLLTVNNPSSSLLLALPRFFECNTPSHAYFLLLLLLLLLHLPRPISPRASTNKVATRRRPRQGAQQIRGT